MVGWVVVLLGMGRSLTFRGRRFPVMKLSQRMGYSALSFFYVYFLQPQSMLVCALLLLHSWTFSGGPLNVKDRSSVFLKRHYKPRVVFCWDKSKSQAICFVDPAITNNRKCVEKKCAQYNFQICGALSLTLIWGWAIKQNEIPTHVY